MGKHAVCDKLLTQSTKPLPRHLVGAFMLSRSQSFLQQTLPLMRRESVALDFEDADCSLNDAI